MMCGIVGYLSTKLIDPKFLERMNNIAKHRGPDDEGYFLFNKEENFFEYFYGNDSNPYQKTVSSYIGSNSKFANLGFGHRRLSIIDTSFSGHQPFSKHNLVIIFNGEIFNYIELREELISNGYHFSSESDTEVILSAYHHWGSGCFERFNGMWSLAILDQDKCELVLSRDRFGIKPLYYYNNGDILLFSSEIKQILEYGIRPIANKTVLAHFIYSKVTMFNHETMFEDIYTVPPSTYTVIKINSPSIEMSFELFYNLENSGVRREQDYNKTVIRLRDLLVDSIEMRLRSDVPLAVSLSGGLDSSLVTSIANKLLRTINQINQLNVYSMVAKDSIYDESYYSDKVAASTQSIKHNVYPSSVDLENELQKIIWHHDEPFQSFSIYAGWQIMREVSKDNVKVILGGQGADEVFLGYEIYYVYAIKYFLKRFHIFRAIKMMFQSLRKSKLTLIEFIKNFAYYGMPLVKRIYKKITLMRYIKSSYLKSLKYPLELIEYNNMKDLDDIQTKSIYMGLQRLLNWEDRNSMAHSVEARLPFLDHRVIDTAYQLDFKHLLRDGWLKGIIRSVSNGFLEDEIAYRKNKIGFDTPDEQILNNLSKEFVDRLFADPKTKDIFDIEYLMDCFKNDKDTEARFTFLVLEVWASIFKVEFLTSEEII